MEVRDTGVSVHLFLAWKWKQSAGRERCLPHLGNTFSFQLYKTGDFNSDMRGLHASYFLLPVYHAGDVEAPVRVLCMQNACAQFRITYRKFDVYWHSVWIVDTQNLTALRSECVFFFIKVAFRYCPHPVIMPNTKNNRSVKGGALSVSYGKIGSGLVCIL